MSERLSSFMFGVYAWMTCALVVAACTAYAYYIELVPQVFTLNHVHQFNLFGLLLIQIGLVVGLSWFLHRMTFTIAVMMFLLYAVLVGATLSIAFNLFPVFSILLIVAGMFGGMSVYGYVTRSDLTAIGNIAPMMLWGLFLGWLTLNLFAESLILRLKIGFMFPGVIFILQGAGVIFFTLLTAYDTQKIKQLGQRMLAEQKAIQKVALLGALTLYLDFINLFFIICIFFLPFFSMFYIFLILITFYGKASRRLT